MRLLALTDFLSGSLGGGARCTLSVLTQVSDRMDEVQSQRYAV